MNSLVNIYPINNLDFEFATKDSFYTNDIDKNQILNILAQFYNDVEEEYAFVEDEIERKINFLESVRNELFKKSKSGLIKDINYLPLKSAFETYNALNMPLELLDNQTLENLFSNVYEQVLQMGLYDLLKKFDYPIPDVKELDANHLSIYQISIRISPSGNFTKERININSSNDITFSYLEEYFKDNLERLNKFKNDIENLKQGIYPIDRKIVVNRKGKFAVEKGIIIFDGENSLKSMISKQYKNIIKDLEKSGDDFGFVNLKEIKENLLNMKEKIELMLENIDNQKDINYTKKEVKNLLREFKDIERKAMIL